MSNVIAVLVSDIHLSEKPPVCRAGEPDWYAAMRRPLDELRDVADEHDVPVIVAGDLFDKWKSSPQLINFALDALPNRVCAIPGQHDIPNHNINEMERSAYRTLVKAGRITNIHPGIIFADSPLMLRPFPWGKAVVPWDDPQRQPEDDDVVLAVVHEFCYQPGGGYPGAPESGLVGNWADKTAGYDAVVVGDNHAGFITNDGHLMNCGTLMRRHANERDYRPQIGLLHDDGTITPHHLDTSKDVFEVEITENMPRMQRFLANELIEDLKELGSDSLDFRAAVARHCDREQVSDSVRAEVMGVIDG